MSLPTKLKNALKSSPATKPLISYLENVDSRVSSSESTLQNAVDNDTIYDDTDLWAAIGISKNTDFTSNDFVPLAERIDDETLRPLITEIVEGLLENDDEPEPQGNEGG